MTDEKLIKASRQGDEQAFKELINRHESRVASTVMGMLGNCPEAEDVGQETFIRFYNSLKNFRGDASVGTYLTRIAINLSINELKKRQRKSKIFFRNLSNEDFDIPDYNNQNQSDDQKEIVQRAIQKLEPKFRSVIVLRLIDGYSTAETAEILKLPIGTVLSRLARGQKKLKEILTPSLGRVLNEQ